MTARSFTVPSAWAAASAATVFSHSSSAIPLRPRPVSTFAVTVAVAPESAAAAFTAASWRGEDTAMFTSSATAPAKSASGVCSQAVSGSVSPAARRARASEMWATPTSCAPLVSAARAACSAPCPYPSALTTAINGAPAASAITPALWAIASRSTVAVSALYSVIDSIVSGA